MLPDKPDPPGPLLMSDDDKGCGMLVNDVGGLEMRCGGGGGGGLTEGYIIKS